MTQDNDLSGDTKKFVDAGYSPEQAAAMAAAKVGKKGVMIDPADWAQKDWVHQPRTNAGTFGPHQADVTTIGGPDVEPDTKTPLEGDRQINEQPVEDIRLNMMTWRPFGEEATLTGDLKQTPGGSHADIAHL